APATNTAPVANAPQLLPEMDFFVIGISPYIPIALGTTVTMAGKKISNSSTTPMGTKNGRTPRNTSPTGMRSTELITKSTVPTGGVSKTNISAKMVTTPKWMGSTANSTATGSKMGKVISSSAVASIKAPRINSSTAVTSRKATEESRLPVIKDDSACGTSSRARIQPKMVAATIMSMMDAVVTAVSRSAFHSVARVSFLYTKPKMMM